MNKFSHHLLEILFIHLKKFIFLYGVYDIISIKGI